MSTLLLADAKLHLNIAAAVTTHDTELQAVIDAAEAAIVEKCGPLTSVEVTERVSGGGTGLVLRETPVVSLTSVTPVNGTVYAVGDFTTDLSAGVIEWTSGARFSVGRYDVVYQAGRATVPKDLLMGIKELVRHTWESQRGPTGRPGASTSAGQANTLPGSAYLFVYRVMEYIGPHIQSGN